jgi:glycosyltransferase involved in cell wall biosynthesis
MSREPRRAAARRVRGVLWGDTTAPTAYARINAAWLRHLQGDPRLAVTSVRQAQELAALEPDFVVHHDYATRFVDLQRPRTRRFIAVRTWDFGPYPPAWAAKIRADCDELWVHSRWTRAQAIASGIEADRVRIVPHGIDETLFRPDGPAHPLTTNRRFRFLFVGATVVRKGVDILLAAYDRAFGPRDDVCLVIKDHPGDVFYRGASLGNEIRARAADPQRPALEYLDAHFTPARLAALYRACDVAVFPYRAEGFCLPALEALASGIPLIVPRFGACLDYASSRNAFFVAARHIVLPVQGRFAFNTLGFAEDLAGVSFCEVDVDALVETLRVVAGTPATRRRRMGQAGARLARSRFRWQDTIRRIRRFLRAGDPPRAAPWPPR